MPPEGGYAALTQRSRASALSSVLLVYFATTLLVQVCSMSRAFVKPLMGLVVCCLCITGCGEEELTSIAIMLTPDGSGTVRLAGLRVPTQPAGFEQHTQGVEFDDRGRVQFDASMGAFANIELEVSISCSISRRTRPNRKTCSPKDQLKPSDFGRLWN